VAKRKVPPQAGKSPETDKAGFRWEDLAPGAFAWLRFQPWRVDKLESSAEDHRTKRQLVTHDEREMFAISVWGARGSAAMGTLIDRLEFSKKWISVVPAEELDDFPISATAGQPDHYDLALGTELKGADLVNLAGIFELHKRRYRG
jgi:hypothetical protein